MNRMITARVAGWVVAVTIAVIGTMAILSSSADTAHGEWPYYGGTLGFTRYSPANLITPENVKGLRILWERPAVDATVKEKFLEVGNGAAYFKSTPIMVDGVLYASNGIGLVEAFDAVTGKTKWIQESSDPTPQGARGNSARGVAYWHGNLSEERVFSVRSGYLYALNATNGKPAQGFGDNGRVALERSAGGRAGGGRWANGGARCDRDRWWWGRAAWGR